MFSQDHVRLRCSLSGVGADRQRLERMDALFLYSRLSAALRRDVPSAYFQPRHMDAHSSAANGENYADDADETPPHPKQAASYRHAHTHINTRTRMYPLTRCRCQHACQAGASGAKDEGSGCPDNHSLMSMSMSVTDPGSGSSSGSSLSMPMPMPPPPPGRIFCAFVVGVEDWTGRTDQETWACSIILCPVGDFPVPLVAQRGGRKRFLVIFWPFS